MLSRAERLDLFFARLRAAPACATIAEAERTLADILNHVEDEHSGVPFNPERWMTDGRMYPSQADNVRALSERPLVVRYRSKVHVTLIAENGAIQISKGSEICLEKPGADGRTVSSVNTA